MNCIDFDGLFDEKIAIYMKQNKKKHSAKGWEDVIPKLYKQFGDTYIAKIKCTPKQYYAKMTDEELVETLVAHLETQIPVSEFLRKEVELRKAYSLLFPLLKTERGEEILDYLDEDAEIEKCFPLLLDEEIPTSMKNALLDRLRDRAEGIKEEALQAYEKGVEQGYMLELLSHTIPGDDRVYQTLLQAFMRAEHEELPRVADAIATYGDERLLPYLMHKMEDESLGFVEFQELKYAVEALGGSYEKERDFSADKDYLRVMTANEKDNS